MYYPDFDPICIKNVYDVYIVINRGVELKEKDHRQFSVLCFGD